MPTGGYITKRHDNIRTVRIVRYGRRGAAILGITVNTFDGSATSLLDIPFVIGLFFPYLSVHMKEILMVCGGIRRILLDSRVHDESFVSIQVMISTVDLISTWMTNGIL